MIPAPDSVYQCPKCDNLLKNRNLLSGNTFGARIFSDSKRIAPMLPEYPNLTKCRKCNTIFWLCKLQEIGTLDWSNEQNPNWENADSADFLTIDDYLNAIETGLAENVDEEVLIRMLIWWAFNDRLRNGKEIFRNESDEIRWKENCLALMALLDLKNDSQKIMLAELNRNLGDFEKCISIIDSIETDNMKWVQEKYRQECEIKNKWVFQLN